LALPKLRGLYAVTPDFPDAQELVHRVRDALAGGATAVQYRSKLPDAALRRTQAEQLLALCRQNRVPLIVNDDLDLALRIGADGVHLGRDDQALATARTGRKADLIVGASCYNDLSLGLNAVEEGATYVAFGAAFASRTKPAAVSAPLALFRQARQCLALPIAAIGGITAENAAPLLEAGVDLLAVISDLFDAPDVAARAARYAALFDDLDAGAGPSPSRGGSGV
jgi:thiamine-phosphate pyrophosphorylase